MIKNEMTLRVTEAELARDITAVLARVREGLEVIVEQDHRPVAVIKTPRGPGRKTQRVYRECEGVRREIRLRSCPGRRLCGGCTSRY